MTTSPVFLPGKSHGQRSLVGYHRWGHKESDQTTRFKKKNTQFPPTALQGRHCSSHPSHKAQTQKGAGTDSKSHSRSRAWGFLARLARPQSLPSSCLWAAQLCMCAFPSLVPHSLVYNAGLEDDASVSVVTWFCLPRMTGH